MLFGLDDGYFRDFLMTHRIEVKKIQHERITRSYNLSQERLDHIEWARIQEFYGVAVFWGDTPN